jgi:hypothetical protein
MRNHSHISLRGGKFVQNLPFSLTPFCSCRQFVFSLNMTWPAAVFLLNRKRLL